LFGSRARGDAGKDSDYDVAVFLRDMADRFAEMNRLADLTTAVRWAFGTYQGPALPGYPKPGERFIQEAISIYRFTNGKIEEDWGDGEFSPPDSCWS
jgi:predicted nucleotidyltransferase